MIKSRQEMQAEEGTRSPIFLLQLRKFRISGEGLNVGIKYDSDKECFFDDDHDCYETELDLFKEGYADEYWDTQSVWLSRVEAQEFADSTHYNGPFRVYGVPAKGQLENVLNETEFKPGVLVKTTEEFAKNRQYEPLSGVVLKVERDLVKFMDTEGKERSCNVCWLEAVKPKAGT